MSFRGPFLRGAYCGRCDRHHVLGYEDRDDTCMSCRRAATEEI